MTGRRPGSLARGYAIGLALLRLDVRAIERFDGGLEEARGSVLAVLVSLPLIFVSMLLFGSQDLATLSRLPVLIVELSATIVAWLAMPILVSVIAPSAGRGERVPLFITVYDYYSAVTVLVYLAAALLIAVSGAGAILWIVLLNIFWLWSFVVSAFAFRAVLQSGWQPAIALTFADFLVTSAVTDWSDALVRTISQT